MTDDPSQPTTPTTPPQPNTPEARTPTGELIDAGNPLVVEPPADSAAPKSAEPPAGAPETYSAFTAPEGVELDPKVIEEAAPIFKELNLSQESAQKLVDFYNKTVGGVKDNLVKVVEDMRADWRAQVAADKDIGSQLESKVRPEIGRLLAKLPADTQTAFKTAMNETGVGDHPAVIKGLYEFSKLVNEGTHVPGNGPSAEGQKSPTAPKPTIAGAMYPHLPQ